MKEEEKLASQRKVDVTLDTPILRQSLFGLRRKSNISAKAFLRVTYKKNCHDHPTLSPIFSSLPSTTTTMFVHGGLSRARTHDDNTAPEGQGIWRKNTQSDQALSRISHSCWWYVADHNQGPCDNLLCCCYIFNMNACLRLIKYTGIVQPCLINTHVCACHSFIMATEV